MNLKLIKLILKLYIKICIHITLLRFNYFQYFIVLKALKRIFNENKTVSS